MRRFNIAYWICLIVWIVISFGFMVFNRFYSILKSDDLNLLLGIIAVAVSIVSLGLANISKPKYNGRLTCWNTHKPTFVAMSNEVNTHLEYQLITFKLDNINKNVVTDLIVNFRLPVNIVNTIGYNNQSIEFIVIKETLIATCNKVNFLGNNNGDCDIHFEHYLAFSRWNSNRNIYVTIAGGNIEPTTFTIKQDMKAKILQSNSKDVVNLN
jgi:hypothetical protein